MSDAPPLGPQDPGARLRSLLEDAALPATDLHYPLGRGCCGAPDATACHQRGLCWMEGVHPASPGYRPAAPDVSTDTGALREALAALLYDNPVHCVSFNERYRMADDLLALPALRDLIAERDQAVGAAREDERSQWDPMVGRVIRLAQQWTDSDSSQLRECGQKIHDAIRGDR